jgi:tetratricopeptide (TPR) repeat protein
MRIGRLFLFFWSLLISAFVFGHTSPNKEMLAKVFAQGNTEYQRGNYASAERYYSQLLSSGVESGPVYYNLGNACFKQKKLGEAIYFWEKAQRMLPADRDIRENLELANLMIVDRIETHADPLPARILSMMLGFFTIAQESRVVLALFVVANLLFAISLVAKSNRNSSRALAAALVIGSLFIVFACSLTWKIYDANYRKKGVVIEQKVDVRSGPGAENITVFTIHEGITVRVHESANGWYQISLPNGWNGWLPQSFVRIL